MILLMGGTSETSMIASALADIGKRVLVSMATDVPLALPDRPEVQLRRGRLNKEQLAALLCHQKVEALVDAMHPYALEAHATAKQAATAACVPYLRWLRAESELSAYHNLLMAADHEQAAQMAVGLKRPILLTVGSRNLATYVRAARAAHLPMFARVLPCKETENACKSLGLHESEVITARGPFTMEDTLNLLRKHRIGTMVTKESGSVGGVPEKLEAAEQAGCQVVVVKRAITAELNSCRTIEELIHLLSQIDKPSGLALCQQSQIDCSVSVCQNGSPNIATQMARKV
jgi:precorrin-6A/cobalt-precorrin-6A reductase